MVDANMCSRTLQRMQVREIGRVRDPNLATHPTPEAMIRKILIGSVSEERKITIQILNFLVLAF